MSGNRAAFRVAYKNSLRNKKRTFYLVSLVALPVMVAVVVGTIVRNSELSPEEQAVSDFGSANLQLHLDWATPEMAGWALNTMNDLEPSAETLEYRVGWQSFGPGLGGRISDVDLSSPLAEGFSTLYEGTRPTAVDEMALSEHLAAALDVSIGDTVTFRNSDVEWTVVGLTSHPIVWQIDEAVVVPDALDRLETDLSTVLLADVTEDSELANALNMRWEQERYAFYPAGREWPMPTALSQFLPEDFYAAMTDEQLAETQRLLEENGQQAANDYAWNLFSNGYESVLPQFWAESRTDRIMFSGDSLVTQPAVISTAVAAVILAEVAFIAGAAFATGIRRRLREIGLMGANGASPQHIRTSVVGEGIVVGVGGAFVGSALGVLLLLIGRDTVQEFVYRRIDEFPLSFPDVLGPAVLAVVACAIAAWVPARTAIGVPTLTALQGRVPVGAPKRWIIPVGLGFAAFGTLLLVVGVLSSSQGGGGFAGAATSVIGVILMIGGVALLAGPLVAWVSSHSERFPITPRIVLRDSGRQRGRAAAAVAATMVILIAPIASLAGLSSSEASTAIYGLTEEHPQLLVKGRLDPATGVTTEPYSESDLAAIQAALPGSTMAEFEVLNTLVEYPSELEARKAGMGENNGGWYIAPERLAVANAQLLELLDDNRLNSALASDGMVLIGIEERSTSITIGGVETHITEVPVSVSRFSFPRVLVTESVAEALSDGERRTFALFQRPGTWWENPFDSPLQAAYETDLNLDLSFSGGDIALGSVYVILFALTLIVVLIVVATVTGLSAAEADNDIRTVVAVGASNGIRRKYLGLQSGLHTLLGALLALPLTLLLVKTVIGLNGRSVTIGNFGTYDYSQMYVPWGALSLLVIGLPLLIGLLTAMTVRSAPTTPPRRAM